MKLTPWFIDGELPVRPGVYNVSCQTEGQSGKWFAHFNGKLWARCWASFAGIGETAADKAMRYASEYGYKESDLGYDPKSWRGIYNEE